MAQYISAIILGAHCYVERPWETVKENKSETGGEEAGHTFRGRVWPWYLTTAGQNQPGPRWWQIQPLVELERHHPLPVIHRHLHGTLTGSMTVLRVMGKGHKVGDGPASRNLHLFPKITHEPMKLPSP